MIIQTKKCRESLNFLLAEPGYRRITKSLLIFSAILSIFVFLGLSPLIWKWTKFAIDTHYKPDGTFQNFSKTATSPTNYSPKEVMSFLKWVIQKGGDRFEQQLRKTTKRNIIIILIGPILVIAGVHFTVSLILPFFPKMYSIFINSSKVVPIYIFLVFLLGYLISFLLMRLFLIKI